MSRPRILLACPISDHKAYILPTWISYIKRLTWAGLDILLVDNSHNADFHRQLKRKYEAPGFTIIHHDPAGKGIRFFMAECNEIIRRYTLKAGYDYLFSLECDIFPPYNIIGHLYGLQKPIAAAPYFLMKGAASLLIGAEVEPNQVNAVTRPFSLDDGFLTFDGKVKPAYAPGLGCVLIHRTILEKVKFRATDQDTAHADSNFYNDLFFLGYSAVVDYSIICRHENIFWDEIYKTEKI